VLRPGMVRVGDPVTLVRHPLREGQPSH
jgi:hypothetical protein